MHRVAALAGLGCVAVLTVSGQVAPAEPTLLQQAQTRLDAGDFAVAERLLEEAWQVALRSPIDETWALRIQSIASFDQSRGKERAAERRLRDALAAAPVAGAHRRTLGIMLGNLLLAQRRPLEARRALEAADQTPGAVYLRQLLQLLSDAQEQTGELAAAEATLRRKLALPKPGPDEPELALMTWLGTCGGTIGLGLAPPVNELAEFFARHERPAAARRELERAVAEVPATAPLADRAGPALGLLRFLASVEARRAEAWTLFERLLAMARAAPPVPPTASALEMESDPAYLLRLSLAEAAAQELGDRNRAVEVYREALAPIQARNAPDRRPLAAYSLSSLLSNMGRREEGQEWFRWFTSRRTASPPQPEAAAATVESHPAESAITAKPLSADKLDRAAVESVQSLNAGETAQFLRRFAKEMVEWEEHHPLLMRALYDSLSRRESEPPAAHQAASRRIAERSLALPAMLDFYPDSSDDIAVLGKRLKLLEAVEGPHSRAVLQTVRALAEALDGEEDVDRLKLWPRARLNWERAVQLTRRHYGEGSRQYRDALDDFAGAADWADQPELAARLKARAAAVKPGTE